MASNLIQRDPFGGLARFDPFITDIDDIFRDFFSMPALRGRESTQRMRVDIAETERSYLVKAEIPGVNKDDIKVSVDGNRVSINAEVKEENVADDGGKLVRSERIYGQQYRSFTLPQEVDDAAAQARYQDGVLELTLPKKAGTGGKQLAVQ
ncbi:Hsp20/alpha crystallin family protein [Janthinobacterium fluminis]|uniref:Hsp20/alpha crystallin family protein n=1 Tax=Janthinobacterium fluminis TaxID=2987524 RepID=A0ABT5JW39_9BURK|nr:Hsp20/alpha crystallin family protein [Janthinobacterium fluminis]MDC8756954.1 Hsp20/alpha crystallin family protein [Janthinobacterium fluminis]